MIFRQLSIATFVAVDGTKIDEEGNIETNFEGHFITNIKALHRGGNRHDQIHCQMLHFFSSGPICHGLSSQPRGH